nr:hypothetical protein [Tanacetum cinerariifolium]
EQDNVVAEQEFAEFQRLKKEAEGEVSALKKRLPEIEIAMEKIELDVQTGAKRVAEAEKRILDLK